MSDPLGLLNTSSDPLGLLTAPRPIPELRAGKYETEGGLWDRLFTGGPAAENAKAQNTMAISAQYGLPPSIVNDHYDEITKQQGFADQPTFRELIEKPIIGGVVAGLLAHPLATAVGIVSFGALSEAENFIASKVASKPYQFGAGRGLADMLPEDTEQGFKDLVWTADMAWKALASGGLIKASKPAAENFAARYMRDTIEKYNLPRTVFFSPEKIREFHGMGREDVITPDEAAILKDIGLTRDQYVSALQNGIDVEIPAEKIINVVDKPWWAAMKQFFKASPYDTTVVSRGKGEAKASIAGLLEEPAAGTATKQPAPATERTAGEISAVETGKVSPVGEIVTPAANKPIHAQAMEVRQGIPPEPGLQNEEVTSTEDINALFDAASRTDAAVGIPATEGYDKIRAQAARIAFENVTKKLDLQKRRQERDLRRQGIEDARQAPVFGAMEEAIKTGGLNRELLRKLYDKDTVKELSRKRVGLVTKDGWMGLDQLADMHGFESDDALMNAMLDWEGLGEAGKKYAQQFEERYSELISEAEMEDFHLQLLEEEAKILRGMIKATGKPSAPGIKKVIREQTGQIRVEELTVSTYEALTAGMKKAEQASRKAFREGKLDGALAEKERQIEMSKSRKEKLKAKEEAKKIHDGLVKLTKDKSIPEDYQDRIQDLLEGFDLLPRSKRSARRVESAREFLERQKEAGEDITIPESMLARIERYGKVHWRELTLDQLREIHDQAQMYAHLGKLKNKLIKAKENRDFEAVVETIVTEIGKNWGMKKVTPEEIETMFLEKTFGEKLGEFKASYLGSLTKVETYLRRLDGFKDLGPIWETIYLPVKQASDVEYRRLTEITKELRGLFDPVKKTLTKEKFRIPGVDQFLTRETVVMAAMNSGNEGNLKALQENRVYNWDEAKINTILGNVKPEEWLLVRGVWDMFEKQYPDLAAVYKNLSGTTLKKVEGDYFPLVFDRKLSWIADRNATEKELRDFFQSIYTLPSVKTGSTIERVGGKLPPKLKFSVIFEKLAEINHYITHAEAVRDVQKILADPRVRAAIEGAPSGIGGPEAYREMMTWLQDVARQRSDPISAVESMVKTVRINTSVVAMGWKFSTAAVQFLGATNTIYKVGAGEFTKALAEFYTNREAMVEKIKGMSPELSGRSKVFDRELRDAYNRIGLDQFRGSQAMKDSFFSLISLMDMAVAYPTWLSAYNKGMKDFAGEESKAIEYADMTTRMTQGTALVKDLAGIQRGPELKKILSLFYTFFSAYHQLMSDAWLKFKFDKTAGNFADFLKAWWWLTILPATIDYMMKEREVPGPGEFIKNFLQMRLTAYPVVRDIMGAVLTDYDYQFSPVARAGEVFGRFAKQTVKAITPDEDVEWDKVLRYGLESAGYMFGLPTGQAVVTMQGLIDLRNGETSDVSRLLFRAPREENE